MNLRNITFHSLILILFKLLSVKNKTKQIFYLKSKANSKNSPWKVRYMHWKVIELFIWITKLFSFSTTLFNLSSSDLEYYPKQLPFLLFGDLLCQIFDKDSACKCWDAGVHGWTWQPAVAINAKHKTCVFILLQAQQMYVQLVLEIILIFYKSI